MDAEEAKAAQAEYGERMLERFMAVLRQPNAYKLHTPCTFRSHQPGSADADKACDRVTNLMASGKYFIGSSSKSSNAAIGSN